MIKKIDNHKIKHQPNTEMLKTIMKKKKLNSSDLLYDLFSLSKKERKKTPQQTRFRFIIFFLNKKTKR